MKRVAVAMSGGVDSSVTAGLLKQQGYDVIGITLRLWEEDPACTIDNVHACCSLSSVDDAKAVASVLGIPHYTLDFRDIFRRDVIDYFIELTSTARRPIPVLPAINSLSSACSGRKPASSAPISWRRAITPASKRTKRRESIPCSAAQTAARTSPMSSIN